MSGLLVLFMLWILTSWCRSYIGDLTTDGTGQIYDLLDIDNGGEASDQVAKAYRKRTRAFISALKKAWKRTRAC